MLERFKINITDVTTENRHKENCRVQHPDTRKVGLHAISKLQINTVLL